MTIKIQDMLAINGFIEKHRTDAMHIKTAFKMNKLTSSFQSDLQLFRETYTGIVNKYTDSSESDLAAGTIKIKEDCYQSYVQEVNELFNVEIEVADVKFSIDELGDYTITPEELQSIMTFLAD